VRPEAAAAVAAALAAVGNPSSVHAAGRAARARVEQARAEVAALIAAPASTVVFTSGGTEANALAIESAVAAGAKRLVVSAIEHDSVRETAKACGAAVEVLPVDSEGVADLAWLKVRLARWDPQDGKPFVALMLANNETGVIQPVARAAGIVRAHDGWLHVDAIQAAGKIAVDSRAIGADTLSVSAHKIGGPQGVGALVVADGAPLRPQILGGGQQKGLRAGTENLSGIAGFGAAAHTLLGADGERARLAHLTERFETALKKALPDVTIFGAGAGRLCSTSNFAIPGIAAETALIALDMDGVRMSAGSTCSSGKIGPSHVLAAMGAEPALGAGALRASFGWSSTNDDIQAAVESLVKLTERNRRLPPKDRAA
jgi:cysteine desulfurase